LAEDDEGMEEEEEGEGKAISAKEQQHSPPLPSSLKFIHSIIRSKHLVETKLVFGDNGRGGREEGEHIWDGIKWWNAVGEGVNASSSSFLW
jgi:hypothetical protein